ncbi:MAG: M28 family peptidase [bacterium]
MKSRNISLTLIMIFLGSEVFSQANPTIQTIINQVSLSSLNAFVNELSGEIQTTVNGNPCNITSRHSNNVDNDSAATYVKERLASFGLSVYDQYFDGNGRNVYAVKQGSLYPAQKYIICAHYDDMPQGSNSPGADDNASGVAAVLEAARILTNFSNDYTLIFALWDKEEQGLYGSDYYAEQADDNNEQILGVINLDMIAYDSDNDMEFDLHTKNVANSIALSNSIQNINSLYGIGLTIDVINPGADYSDHWSFWEYGFSAILMIEDDWDFNEDYHTSSDVIDNFNSTYFLKCAKLAIASVAASAGVNNGTPVELLSFSGTTNNHTITLSWSTATELNNYGFEIERSCDKKTWVNLGFVKGKSNSSEISYYDFTDAEPHLGKNFYQLIQKDLDGSYEIFSPIEIAFQFPDQFILEQNYPNPYNPTTTIGFNLPEETNVNLKIYNLLGEEIALLINEKMTAGFHEVKFDANTNPIPSGIYIYRLNAGEQLAIKKMILSK